jgi:hypothetical protein
MLKFQLDGSIAVKRIDHDTVFNKLHISYKSFENIIITKKLCRISSAIEKCVENSVLITISKSFFSKKFVNLRFSNNIFSCKLAEILIMNASFNLT